MLMASVLFAVVIHKIMLLPQNSIEELLKPYFFGNILLITVQLFLLVLYSAMLSAGGEALYSVFGIKKAVGALITAVISIAVIWKGCSGITDLSQVLFIPIALIIFIICVTTTEKSIAIPSATIITPKAVISPFIYVSYNMLTTIPLLISIPDKYMYRSCGNQVGIVIFLLSVMLMLPLYTHYSAISTSALPIMDMLNGNVKYLYEFLLMLAILTTAVSSGYSLCSCAKHIAYNKAVLFFTFAALVLSGIGFANIVNRVYFVFGAAGIILLVIILKGRR